MKTPKSVAGSVALAVTLTGSVDSTFDAGCGGAPGGTVTYSFALVRY